MATHDLFTLMAIAAAVVGAPANARSEAGGQDSSADPAPVALSADEPEQATGTFDYDGKLLLTNGVTTIEGTSGGGIASWATLAGMKERGLGVSGQATFVLLPDFGWQSHGVAASWDNRVELSYARQNFDTRDAGAALGLGQGYTFGQDVFGAKVRVIGDLVYGDPLLPQISLGIQHKRSRNDAVVAALGAAEAEGTDFYVSATKLVLSHSVLASGTLRLTKANQNGLLGFGSAAHPDYGLQFEGSLAYQLSRRVAVGAEYRSKPDNLRLGEDDWMDVFAAYAPTDFLTFTAAYADLGSIATFGDQRGTFLQAQLAF